VEVWEIRCVKDSSDLLFVLLWIWKWQLYDGAVAYSMDSVSNWSCWMTSDSNAGYVMLQAVGHQSFSEEVWVSISGLFVWDLWCTKWLLIMFCLGSTVDSCHCQATNAPIS
jgi:hypothetical protein